MTRDEIIEVAKEAGICLQDMQYHYPKLDDNLIDKLRLFLYLASGAVFREGFEDGIQHERKNKY